jgi:hypothetical protein
VTGRAGYGRAERLHEFFEVISPLFATLSLFVASCHHERDTVHEVAPAPVGHRPDPELMHAPRDEPVEHLLRLSRGRHIDPGARPPSSTALGCPAPAALAGTTTELDTRPVLTASGAASRDFSATRVARGGARSGPRRHGASCLAQVAPPSDQVEPPSEERSRKARNSSRYEACNPATTGGRRHERLLRPRPRRD